MARGVQQPISEGFEQMLREDAERADAEPPAPALFEAAPPPEPLQRFEVPEVDWRAEQEERDRAERAARETKQHAEPDAGVKKIEPTYPAKKQSKKSPTPNLDAALKILGRDAK